MSFCTVDIKALLQDLDESGDEVALDVIKYVLVHRRDIDLTKEALLFTAKLLDKLHDQE